ncbi:RGS domain-containing protein [Peziza echinospora]|nr:RGS domain-containing protein [Peziza echinospora]
MSGRRSRRPPSLNLSISSADTTSSRRSSRSPPSVISDDEHSEDDPCSHTSAYTEQKEGITMAHNYNTQTPYSLRRPTLADILSNTAPPPYTLSAFMAYLSQNHCLETLEFTMDASRYRKHFNSLTPIGSASSVGHDTESCQYVRMLWQKLLDAYIAPNGPREVNLPHGIRETLLNTPNHTMPPPPESLDPAVNIIYELMEESVLMPFLNSCAPFPTYPTPTPWASASSEDLHLTGSLDERALRRNHMGQSGSPSMDRMSNSYSPSSSSSPSGNSRHMSPFSPAVGWPRQHPLPQESFSSSSYMPNTSGDSVATTNTDEYMGGMGAGGDMLFSPMTPPSTPPMSDSAGSPKYGKGETSWKKMTGKLSWKRKTGESLSL